ncbi:hypothetical protein FNV43_RR05506 [Rhamnella rubrinervis]|uniref:Uncharacterized protein n=1 Tax=Rhamnella rubrinervis TaxID=2594499 RepID=A0A8K0HN31_9ROSA|nr:hypothetical protein FNV43_RR05506 [Rhamnella rubrinervis]
MEDRHAVRIYQSKLLRLVMKDLQDGRSSMPYYRAFLIQSSYRDLQDGMEDRPSCRMAGPPCHIARPSSSIFIYGLQDGMEDRPSCSPDSLIFTFKIGEEGLRDGRSPCHIEAFLIHLHIWTRG